MNKNLYYKTFYFLIYKPINLYLNLISLISSLFKIQFCIIILTYLLFIHSFNRKVVNKTSSKDCFIKISNLSE